MKKLLGTAFVAAALVSAGTTVYVPDIDTDLLESPSDTTVVSSAQMIAVHEETEQQVTPNPPIIAPSLPADTQPQVVPPEPSPVQDQTTMLAQVMMTYRPDLNPATMRSYAERVKTASSHDQIDPLWVLAIMWQESRFDNVALSDVGAIGLMQMLPATARGMGVSSEGLHDPATNIEVGVRYLAYLRDRFSGNLRTATIAYNQGEGNVARDTYQTWYYESVSKHYHNMISLSTTSR